MHTKSISLSIIVAMNEKRIIGDNGKLPWHIPSDMQHFRAITGSSVIVMGRKTHESIGKPLNGRVNVVLSRQTSLQLPGCEVASSLEQAMEIGKEVGKPIFVIGGGEIYHLTLPYAEKIFLTLVHNAKDCGDVTFPELPQEEWRVVFYETGYKSPKDEFGFSFIEYERK